ncbi:class I SAM-dependent methyltransferase [Streptomyces rimosus]|uniref:class I SAM-dependent methyltransferase n=1 Tax=Streptomyces rimosus TaxID=1927 RepID=UPI000AC169EC|nr:class I SAM-dependent methyltransferase [Streptomyces rimosus]
MELTKKRLFEMVTGYQVTAVLHAGLEVGVFDALADGVADATTVAERLGLDRRACSTLLDCLALQGLLIRDGAWFSLGPGVRDLLVSTEPSYAGGIHRVAASAMEWQALGRLAEAVRYGGPLEGFDSTVPDFPYWRDFAATGTFATHRLAGMVAHALEPRTAGRPGPRILDVGCGSAAVGIELVSRHPGAHLWAQDWPTVLAVTEKRAKEQGVDDRTTLLPGDAFDIPLGGPYDVIVAANLLFHFSPQRAGLLLARLAEVLAPQGSLVIAGFAAGEAAPAEDLRTQLLDLMMLCTTPGGQMHSTHTYARMLTAVGLTEHEVHTQPGSPLKVVVGTRPRGSEGGGPHDQ